MGSVHVASGTVGPVIEGADWQNGSQSDLFLSSFQFPRRELFLIINDITILKCHLINKQIMKSEIVKHTPLTQFCALQHSTRSALAPPGSKDAPAQRGGGVALRSCVSVACGGRRAGRSRAIFCIHTCTVQYSKVTVVGGSRREGGGSAGNVIIALGPSIFFGRNFLA